VLSNRKQKNRKGKIQLIDARERWKPMRRSLGNKRRYLGEDDIVSIVKEYGGFSETDTSKIFENEDFGYNRVQIERPLRLLYQMDVERKSRFLDAVPHLLDDVQAIDKELGREPRENWTIFDELVSELLKRRSSKWKATEKKLFRDVFADKNADAAPVVLKERKPTKEKDARVWGWFYNEQSKTERMYEPDVQLRDNENIRLKEDIAAYFLREVEPHVSDAWADAEKIAPAYEINFNRYFYTYTPPRPLVEIDADIKGMEEEIMRLLREVTA
jgi:type I restriction enzyme M protein